MENSSVNTKNQDSNDNTSIDSFNVASGNYQAIVGTRIGEYYQVEKVLGTGGMSVVFLATQELLQKKYAIKMLLPHLVANEISLQRFQNEGRAISDLNHPNIINIQYFGTFNDSIPYLVMDYIAGISLADLIKDTICLNQNRALFIFGQIAQAIRHAHSKGIIHRDLKPSNVMILPNENDLVKILDFGIAKMLTENEDIGKLTKTGDIFGSPFYMSPEQCRGEKLDARSDIYSLGCLMYETLIGKPPLVGNNLLESLHLQLNEIPKPFKDVNPKLKISANLEAIVFKALAKDPQNRYQNMDELLTDLAKVSNQSQNDLTNIIIGNFKLWKLRLKKYTKQDLYLYLFYSVLVVVSALIAILMIQVVNNIYLSINLNKELKLMTFNSKILPKPAFDQIAFLNSEIAAISNKTVNHELLNTSDIASVKQDLLMTKKYGLYNKSIELYMDLILNDLSSKNDIDASFQLFELNDAIVNLANIVYAYYPQDYLKPINQINYLKFLNQRLKDFGQVKLSDKNLAQIEALFLPKLYESSSYLDNNIVNKLVSQSYLNIANSYYNTNNFDQALNSYKLLITNIRTSDVNDPTNWLLTATGLSKMGNIYLKQYLTVSQGSNLANQYYNLARFNLSNSSKFYDKLAKSSTEQNEDEFHLKCLYNEVLCYIRLAILNKTHNDRAVNDYSLALNILEETLPKINDVNLKSQFNDTIVICKLKCLPLLLQQWQFIKAMDYIQSGLLKYKLSLK